jgi:chromosome partitioning protein
MIILIGGEKGGTGKTTIATNLASIFKHNGRDVLLVDTDKQGSASFWCATRDELVKNYKQNPGKFNSILDHNITSLNRIPNIQKFGDSITNEITELKTKYQDILIDAGGRDSIELRAAITVCDLLYIPVQASQFDIWTLGVIDNLVTQGKIYNKKIKAFVLFNRVSTNPGVNEVVESSAAINNDFENLSLCKSIFKDRIIYRKAAKNGLAVTELAKQDIKANAELDTFYKEVINE